MSQTLKYTPCTKEPVSYEWGWLVAPAVIVWLSLPFYRNEGHNDFYLSGSPMWAVTAVVVYLFVGLLIVYVVTFHWEGETGYNATVGLGKHGEEEEEKGDPPSFVSEVTALRTEMATLRAEIVGQVHEAVRQELECVTSFEGKRANQTNL